VELEYILLVRFFGILIILLMTIGSASADVVLTKELNQGSVLISVTYDVNNNAITSLLVSVTKEDLDLGKVDSLSKATCTVNSNTISSNLVSTEIKADTEIPEFPTMVLPVAAILGLLFLYQHKRKEK
jgi:hypothetical protein